MTESRRSASTLTSKTDRTRYQLYVVTTRAIVDPSALNERRSAHLSYLHHLEQDGRLLGAGPVLSEDAAYYDGHGLFILRAESLAQARELAEADPFHQSGLREFTVTPWLLSEGALHTELSRGRAATAESGPRDGCD